MRHISLLLSLSLCVFTSSFSVAEEVKPAEDTKAIFYLQKEDMYLGDEKSPVIMIEYSSTTCPHCADFHKDVLPKIQENYITTGKVVYILRDLPTNKASLLAAKLAHCGTTKQQYFDFISAMMESQSIWAFNKNYQDSLMNIGKLGGLTQSKITECFNDSKLEESILKKALDASKVIDIQYTPTFIINGKKYQGAHKYEEFQKAIDAELFAFNKQLLEAQYQTNDNTMPAKKDKK